MLAKPLLIMIVSLADFNLFTFHIILEEPSSLILKLLHTLMHLYLGKTVHFFHLSYILHINCVTAIMLQTSILSPSVAFLLKTANAVQIFFALCMWFQFVIIDIFHFCFIQNGTKDSISKLVSDLNSAKLEADVGKINFLYSLSCLPAGICCRTSAIGFYLLFPKSFKLFGKNLVGGQMF